MKIGTRPALEVLLTLLAAFAPACTSVEQRIADDRRDLVVDMRERAGIELFERMDDRPFGELAEETRTGLGRELDVDTAVRIALRESPRLRMEFARLGVSSARLVMAGRVRNPVLSASATFFGNGTEFELGLVQPLLDLVLRGRRASIAKAEFEATEARVAGAILALVGDVRRAVVDLRGARMMLALRNEALRARQASLEMARTLFAAGNVTEHALALEDAALARSELAVVSAETEAAEAREAVLAVLGLFADEGEWTADAPLDAVPTAALDPRIIESTAVEKSLDLRASGAAARLEGERAGVARWSALSPRLDAGVTARREADGEQGLGPMLEIGVPVFDSGRAVDAASREQLNVALERVSALQIDVRSAARILAARVNALVARERLERETHLPRARRVVETMLQRFNAMQVGAFDVIRVKEVEIEARVRHVQTLRALHRAQVDLGELLSGHLRHVGESPSMPEAMFDDGATETGGH